MVGPRRRKKPKHHRGPRLWKGQKHRNGWRLRIAVRLLWLWPHKLQLRIAWSWSSGRPHPRKWSRFGNSGVLLPLAAGTRRERQRVTTRLDKMPARGRKCLPWIIPDRKTDRGRGRQLQRRRSPLRRTCASFSAVGATTFDPRKRCFRHQRASKSTQRWKGGEKTPHHLN